MKNTCNIVDYLPVKFNLTYILACLLDLAAKNR